MPTALTYSAGRLRTVMIPNMIARYFKMRMYSETPTPSSSRSVRLVAHSGASPSRNLLFAADRSACTHAKRSPQAVVARGALYSHPHFSIVMLEFVRPTWQACPRIAPRWWGRRQSYQLFTWRHPGCRQVLWPVQVLVTVARPLQHLLPSVCCILNGRLRPAALRGRPINVAVGDDSPEGHGHAVSEELQWLFPGAGSGGRALHHRCTAAASPCFGMG